MIATFLLSALLSVGHAQEPVEKRPILPMPVDARITIASKGYRLEGQYYLLPEERFDTALKNAQLLKPSPEGEAAGFKTSLDEAKALVVDAHRTVADLKANASEDAALIDDQVAELLTAGNTIERLSIENKYLRKDVRKTTMILIAAGVGSAVVIGVESYLLVRLTLL